jgi:hypothetical protein
MYPLPARISILKRMWGAREKFVDIFGWAIYGIDERSDEK